MSDWKHQELREETARREVGHTRIAPALSRVIIALFLIVILSVPAVQHLSEFRSFLSGERRSPLPQAWDVFSLLPAAMKASGTAGSSWIENVFTVNRNLLKEMKKYEETLDDRSTIGKWLRPRIQHVLTAWLGAGNEKAYCGSRPWLFYRPGVDYLAGPPFLDPVQLRKRGTGGDEWAAPTEPDPRAAILNLHEQLSRRGISLIVMPTPIKAMIHPEKLSGRYDRQAEALQNPSYRRFKEEMEGAGVLVFDAAPALMEWKRQDGRAQFLASDTHWRPEAMEKAAAGLKEFIERHVDLPSLPAAGYHAESDEVTHLGDLAVMLSLPVNQRIFPQEKVTIRRITGDGGEAWQPRPNADVLVLGDSFSNIYSLGAMGWGEGAGFIEHLSLAMQRPLDRITRNDNGSFATREFLAGEMARGRDRLAGKRLVIYQFAIRELAVGNWKRIDLKTGTPEPVNYLTLPPGTERIVRGRIQAVSTVPRPGTVPYKDHVMAIHLTELTAEGRPLTETDAMVYMSSMTDNALTAAARYRPDEMVALRLSSWTDVAGRYEGINRSELDDEALQLVEPCWGEPLQK